MARKYNFTEKTTPKETAIYVRLKPSVYKKATKLKKKRAQTWVSYIEELIKRDALSFEFRK